MGCDCKGGEAEDGGLLVGRGGAGGLGGLVNRRYFIGGS